MVNPIKLLLCDLDGTLVDTIADIAAALNHALATQGLPPHPVAAVRGMVGEGARNLVERGAGTTDATVVDPILGAFRDRYGAFPVVETRLYDGVADALAKLDGRVKVAVATNKPGPLSRVILERLGVTARFFRIVGPDDVGAHKPDPTMLRCLMDEAGARPEETMLIGDSAIDAEAARRAGIHLALVRYGYTDAAEIERMPARCRVDRFDEILTHLSLG